jgi:hypothetical protein
MWVVDAWCLANQPEWVKYQTPNAPIMTNIDFLKITNGFTPEQLSDRFFGGNKQRTSTHNGILKAEAAVLYAKALEQAGINGFEDIRIPEKARKGRAAVSTVTGQASGISYDYFLMLAGDDSYVKADTMIRRFVSNANGLKSVTVEQAREAVIGACKVLKAEFPNLSPRLLDHQIWKYQRDHDSTSKRPILKKKI